MRLSLDSIPTNRVFLLLFIVLLVSHAMVICSIRLYPFVDIPNHLAAATILRYYDEPSSDFAEYYEVDSFPKPNVFHLYFCGLGLFPSVQSANRIFFCTYVFLLPVAALLIIRKLGGDRWFSLLCFPFLYNYNVSSGLVGFAISVPCLLLLVLVLVIGERGRAVTRRSLGAVLLLLLFFMHAMASMFGLALFFGTIAKRHGRSLRMLLKESMVAVPALAVIAAWVLSEQKSTAGFDFLSYYYREEYASSLFRWVAASFLDNYHLCRGLPGYLIGALFSLPPVLLITWGFVRSPRFALQKWISNSTMPLFMLAALSLLCFLLLPHRIPGVWCGYQRFSSIVFISVAILGSLIPIRMATPVKASMFTTLAVFHLVLWVGYVNGFERENSSFRPPFLPDAEPGIRMGALIVDYEYRGRPLYVHFPSYFTVWKRGISVCSLVDYEYGLVKRKADEHSLPRYLEPPNVLESYDGRYAELEYLLVRGEMNDRNERQLKGFALARSAGLWKLYKAAKPDRQTRSVEIASQTISPVMSGQINETYARGSGNR